MDHRRSISPRLWEAKAGPLTPRSIPMACVTAYGKAADNCWTVAGLDQAARFKISAIRAARTFFHARFTPRHGGESVSLPPHHCFLVRKSVRERVVRSPAITDSKSPIGKNPRAASSAQAAASLAARIELFSSHPS